MKKALSIVALALCAALFAACQPNTAPDVTRVPTQQPTSAPTAAPKPMLYVLAGESKTLFAEAATAEHSALYGVERIRSLDELPSDSGGGSAVLLWYLEEALDSQTASALGERGFTLVVYDPDGLGAPEGVNCIRGDAGSAESEMLEACLAYPPHDTPVRLFGVFRQKDSQAHRLWNDAADAGKIFVKSTYYENGADGSVSDWIKGRLEKYFPGMMDGIYVESASAAVEIVKALTEAGREDMEVFCTESSAELYLLSQQYPTIVPLLYGMDDQAMGTQLRRAAETVLLGGEMESGSRPMRVYSPLAADAASPAADSTPAAN